MGRDCMGQCFAMFHFPFGITVSRATFDLGLYLSVPEKEPHAYLYSVPTASK
jgi:hypothetical protein